MHIARKYLPIAIIAVSLAVAAALVALRQPPAKQAVVTPPLLVRTMAVVRGNERMLVHSQGTVVPYTQTTLVSEVSGKVLYLSPSFITGGLFQTGEELIRIDPSDYQVSVKVAEATLAGAKARLAQETARAEQAREDWRAIGKGKASALVLRKPYVAEAQAKARSATADVQRAQRELSRTRVRAPYDGLVRKKLADIGQYVTPGSQLGIVFATDHAEVRLPLSREDRKFVRIPRAGSGDRGSAVILRTHVAGQDTEYAARLVRDEGVVDEKSRLVHVIARIDDPYRRSPAGTGEATASLEIGSFVAAEIQGIQFADIAVVPRQAVHGNHQVYTVDKHNHLHLRTVSTLRADTKNLYVRQGLVAGERIVVSAIGSPVEGMLVQQEIAALDLSTADRNSGVAGSE